MTTTATSYYKLCIYFEGSRSSAGYGPGAIHDYERIHAAMKAHISYLSFFLFMPMVLNGCVSSEHYELSNYRELRYRDTECSKVIDTICAIGQGWTKDEFHKLMSLIENEKSTDIDLKKIISIKKTDKAIFVNEATYSITVANVRRREGSCESWSGQLDVFKATVLTLENELLLKHDYVRLVEPSVCAPGSAN